MKSEKGYYIDIENGVVYTAEEREEVFCKKFANAINELEQLKELLNEYFCLFNVLETHTNLEKLAHEISMREQSIDYVIDLLKGGLQNDTTE